ncbi:MAG: NTP transferase domain-containing protein [Nitrospinae bacterium]|nr:NTP transferase domain-containing protein [Nitrospinota bacterium]
MERLAVIILAAGKGKRMKSHLPKVLHPLADKPLLAHVIDLARGLNPERIIIVIGHGAEKVRQWSGGSSQWSGEKIEFVEQREQLGTGHAVQQTEESLRDYDGNILILSGDVPLLGIDTVSKLIKIHINSGAVVTILTAKVDNPAGYGRIVRDAGGRAINIIEEKDASPEIKKIAEINSGIYCFKKDFLFNSLKKIDKNNLQQEYYLTDVVGLAFRSSLKIETLIAEDPNEIMGINTQEELREAEARLKRTKT